jgi:CRP/FNR family transcriptional regulator, cyclic AMP receptor protein
MNIYPLDQCPAQAIDALVSAISLYRQVIQIDPDQFRLLLRHSQILDLRPGEVVIEPGQIDSWLYFLLRGQLVIYAGEKRIRRVNSVTPGEVFGDVAVLMDHMRSALVIADTRCKHSTVVRTDFSIFGEVDDLSRVGLPVKLIFYRNIVHNLRWKLEQYRTQFPQYPFADHHRRVRLFSGDRETLVELVSLDTQARQLAELLMQWNTSFLQDSID